MSVPVLTVLMTVRNGEPYLHEAVASIVNQTYDNFRFLILDNASTDNSRAVIRAFDDPRIDLVELREDIGQTAALNRGLEMIETPWIARMDADDVSLPERLDLQMAYLQRHPEVILIGTAVRRMNARGGFLGDRNVLVSDTDLRWLLLMGVSGFGHSSAVFATEAVRRAGGYPGRYRYAQDYALWCRLVDMGPVTNIPQPLVCVRYHNSSITDFDLAEQEIRDILRLQLRRLFPGDSEDTLTGVAAALRGLRSDSRLMPTGAMTRCLSALPERFKAAYGRCPSQPILRQYSYHWLSMVRRAGLISPTNALGWAGLALRCGPAFFGSSRLWYTLASVAQAALRRRKAVR